MRWLGIILLLLVWSPPMNASDSGHKPPQENLPKNLSEEQLRKTLTKEQYEVTQHEGTEAPFKNAYWNNHDPGIYVDVVSGEPLFSSLDKFDSGTGWPSFTKPLESSNIVARADRSVFEERVEVHSLKGHSHLGHVFEDGPKPNGLRYCINSASLRFIPVKELQAQGYGQYLPLFGKGKAKAEHEIATLAGGCFWGVEEFIQKLPGVIDTRVGYTGGLTENPTYKDVKTGTTGHAESIEITFDPSKLSYENLLKYFFRLHDPTTKNRQGNDVGAQYRSSIFYHSEKQRETAEKVKAEVDHSGKWKQPITTEIVAAGKFYPAEEYHQKYLIKHPDGYSCHYLRD